MDGYKHYARVDENNIVIQGFSDAFESPLDTDICIDEDAQRHFQLQLKNANGESIYKYANGKLVDRTADEMFNLDQYKKDEIDFLSELYKSELNSGFISNSLGETPVEFSYDFIAQNRFDKKATLLSINPSIDSIEWATKSNGFIIMTRDQFISVLNEAAQHETDLSFKLLYAEANIINAISKEDVDLVADGW
jgi:hypothetical protein